MSVEEILRTHRRPLIADVATLAACIDECATCAATCTICADACLAEPDIETLARCIRLCLDCADACVDAGRILSRQTDPDADTQLTALAACLTACRACAAECERHAHHPTDLRVVVNDENAARAHGVCDPLGRVSRNWLPASIVCNDTSPPCARAICWTMASPMPLPGTLWPALPR